MDILIATLHEYNEFELIIVLLITMKNLDTEWRNVLQLIIGKAKRLNAKSGTSWMLDKKEGDSWPNYALEEPKDWFGQLQAVP